MLKSSNPNRMDEIQSRKPQALSHPTPWHQQEASTKIKHY